MLLETRADLLAYADAIEYRNEAMLADARAFISRPNFTLQPAAIWWPPHPDEAPRPTWNRVIAGCAGMVVSGALAIVLILSLVNP